MAVSPLTSGVANASTAQVTAARAAADPFAKTLNSAISSASQPPGYSPTSDASMNVADLRKATDLTLADFRRSLKQLFKDANVDTSQIIHLESDGNGGVTVVGQHPDRDKIEKIFADNPDLAAKFQVLAARCGQLQAAQKGGKADQPLIGPTFGLMIHNDDYQVGFG